MTDRITPREAASLLGYSSETLRKWSDAGKLHCVRIGNGHRRYSRAEIENLLKQQQIIATIASIATPEK